MRRRPTTDREARRPGVRMVLAVGIATTAVTASALTVTAPSAQAQAAAAPSVTANASATRAATIEVTFTAVDGALGYLVVPQRLRSDGSWVVLDGREERLSARRPVVFDGLANGATYRACVAAILPDGQRTGLSTSAVPYGLPGAPAISSVERSGTDLEVTWSPAAANGRQVTAYEVTVAPDDGVAPVVVGGNETSATVSGLRANAEYVVSVRATNLRGQGEAGQSAAAAIGTSGASDDGMPPVLTVALVTPSDTGASMGDVVLVSGAGACGDSTTTGGTEGGTDDATQGGAGDDAGAAATSDGSSGDAGSPAPPAARRQPLPSTTGEATEATDEADAGEEAAPEPEPTPAVPQAPDAAPEAAAPAPAPAEEGSRSGRSTTLVWVGLLGLAALVIGVVVVQQRTSSRVDA